MPSDSSGRTQRHNLGVSGRILVDFSTISALGQHEPIILDDDAADGYVSIASREVGLVQGLLHERF
jgi:hypothetical protein